MIDEYGKEKIDIYIKKVEKLTRKQIRGLARFGCSLVFYKITTKDDSVIGFQQHSMGLSNWNLLDDPEPDKSSFSPIIKDKDITVEELIKHTYEHSPNNIYKLYIVSIKDCDFIQNFIAIITLSTLYIHNLPQLKALPA